MPRQARLDAPGTLHHVIIRGIARGRIVSDGEDRKNFVSRMAKNASDNGTTIHAWALMPDHAHILLYSGPDGLSKYMRRFLTGYAITHNRRHGRHGHLFENRYKSIVCDEDSYFLELVRYIHLNPLRGKLVRNLGELERYPWCGHGAILGRTNYEWQDRDYVLRWFGKREGEAKKAYRQYIREGIAQGKRPDLVGGGLIRSLGGWSQVLSLRRNKERILTDERILGSGDFVERVYREADEKMKYQLLAIERGKKVEELVQEVCRRKGVNIKELRMGSRRGYISKVRSQLADRLVEEYGLPLAETARQLGVSTSAISKVLQRKVRE